MGFHGTTQTPTLDPLTPITTAGFTLGAGATSQFYGGLSAYSELVLGFTNIGIGANVSIEVQFYPSDDPTLPTQPGGETHWSQFFTCPPSVGPPVFWRIPLSSGTVRLVNHTQPAGAVGIVLYASQGRHERVIQAGYSITPRHFRYSGALANGVAAVLQSADGGPGWLTVNGTATISIVSSAPISCILELAHGDSQGIDQAPPYTPTFTGTSVFNDVAIPPVPCVPQVFSGSSVGAVTIDAYFTPANGL